VPGAKAVTRAHNVMVFALRAVPEALAGQRRIAEMPGRRQIFLSQHRASKSNSSVKQLIQYLSWPHATLGLGRAVMGAPDVRHFENPFSPNWHLSRLPLS
jgi:hypothetical protein